MSAEGALGYWMMARRFASRSFAFPNDLVLLRVGFPLDPAPLRVGFPLRTAFPLGWAGPLSQRTAMYPWAWDKLRPAPFACTLHRHPQGAMLTRLQLVGPHVFMDISSRLPTQSLEFL